MISPIQSYLDRLFETFTPVRDGTVATYIPELAKADPEWFAISLTTADGKVYEVGDSRQTFTIQSISKPFVYGLALEDVGRDQALSKISVEPTGDAFNSISLEPATGRPLNPMINAGAIAATSLIRGHSASDKLSRLVAVLSLYAGRSLSIDAAVFESERSTGHRNRAIGHMLRNFDILTEDPTEALDLYFQQCSVSVDCRDLSVMAATLANGGINPLTREQAIRPELVDNVLSVMTTCGMYDYSGEWVYWVGMPAKSGVAGGVVAVLPGQLGIGVFSPRLDARGNSVRGVEVCKRLSRDFRLHSLRVVRSTHSAIRAQYDVAGVGSKRMRDPEERALLDKVGRRGHVIELQGDIGFAGIEGAIRRLVEQSDTIDAAVIDLGRATQLDDATAVLLFDLIDAFTSQGKRLALSSTAAHRRTMRHLEERFIERGEVPFRSFPDLDRALEWCEEQLLTGENFSRRRPDLIELAQHQICSGLSEQQRAVLREELSVLELEKGSLVVRRGEKADRMFLLVSGEVSITVDLPNGQIRRLATFSPDMVFGDLAFISGGPRTADVRVDQPVRCYVLTTESFERLGTRDPQIKIILLQNLLANAARMIGRANHELSVLIS